MSELRALLLTDVVDSTKLSERIGDAALAEVWRMHDRVARDLLPVWRGREIDKTDGMLLLFESAADAGAYALAYHRALTALPVPLQARAGLHVGPVILRENDPADVARGAKPLEVDGLSKPTAARVMSVARPGQTLLSAQARASLGDTGLRIVSHGHWVMKGLGEPVELFEIGDDGTTFAAPTDGEKVYRVVLCAGRWVPVREVPNNLPLQSTSFIGRERELDEAKRLLTRTRLVTLLGMGGLGKTRLSLQVAAEVIAEYPDGAWFLDLSRIRDPALVVGETAQMLGVREEPGRTLTHTLCGFLKNRRTLIIFDNCEHLVEAAAELMHAILGAAPEVRLLASSRAALHVPGEQSYPILPLPLPERGDDLETLARSTAVRLFVERAQAHKPAFALNEREAPAVAELVVRLEGIPLALELAAARVRSLSIAEINARLSDRYKMLTGGARVLQERQRTLRALVDWSHELLDESEQRLFSRLAVFVGGFDLAAAEAVCGAVPLSAADVPDVLGSLVDKSLVSLDDSGDAPRYRMLETLREYAVEKLDQGGEPADIAARHCQHFFVMAKDANQGMKGTEQARWIERLETEHDNVRSAMAVALAGAVDPLIAVKFAVAMQGFWTLRGYVDEGRKHVLAALQLPVVQSSDIAQAHALYVGAALAASQSDHGEAVRMLERCLELRRRLGNPIDIAAALSTLAFVRLQKGEADRAAIGEREALDLFARQGDRVGEAVCRLHLGQIRLHAEDDAEAVVHLESALDIARQLGHQELQAECELTLGRLAFEGGELDVAARRFARSFTTCREAGDRRGVANAVWWLGVVDLERGRIDAARPRLAEALNSFRAFDMRDELLACLEDHARLAFQAGDAPGGWRIARAAASSRRRLGLVRSPRAERRWQQLQRLLSEAVGVPEGASSPQGDGDAMGIDDVFATALAV